MEFEWDDVKRDYTLQDRGLDFRDVVEIFDNPHVTAPARSDIEPRFAAIGMHRGHVITVFFTYRGDAIRIISARRARRHERNHYHAHLP
ncbi:MAG: BrnT family toxin [Pararhodobacter sp.]|nr:BrnT family toxin [Pararhodobacter sp.]